jgi:hypothetical protein
VRGIPFPFINLDERERDTPHPSLLPLVPMRKDFLDEILAAFSHRRPDFSAGGRGVDEAGRGAGGGLV